jgi:hypothetical protein
VIPEALSIPLDEGRQDPPGLLAIDAETADAAYEQLVHALEQAPRHLLNVTCVVREPESAERLPTNFAGQIDHPETWLRDAVDWWQKAAPALVAEGAAPFNHGERLYSTGPEPGALVQAAERLGSTTAMVLLVANHELQPGGKSPAFVAVQLVRAGDEKGDRLDCVGYFRKQDLTLWWPVNVAELREIQRRVLDLESVEGIRPGRLVTISVEAIHDEYLPQLAGTRVDRLVDLRPSDIIQLAYSAAHGSDEHRDTINKQWKDVLGDIGSPHTRDFPSLGVRELIEHLRLFESLGAPNNIAVLIKRLERVYDRAHRARTESKTKSATQKYGKELFALMTEVLDAVDTAIGGGDPPQG